MDRLEGQQADGGSPAASMIPAPWAALALALIGAGIGGFVLLQMFRPQPAPSPPGPEATLVRAQAIGRHEGPLPVRGQGFVRPRAEVRLTAEVGAEVLAVSPDLVSGGRFARGDTLVQLDPRRFEAALAQIRAELKAQQARLTFAEKQLARAAHLKTGGFAAEARVDELESQKQQAEAAMDALNARIAQLKLDLENTHLTAPFDGAVRSENVEPGDVVQPGTEIARIFATDAYEITVSLDSRDAVLVPGILGNPGPSKAGATVSADYGGVRFEWPAKVDRSELALDERARGVNVVVRISDPLNSARLNGAASIAGAVPLLVGVFAQVVIDGRDAGVVALIPPGALRDGGKAYLIASDNTLAIVPVEILYEDGDTAYVDPEALAPYKRIIVSEVDAAIEGMAVRELSDTPDSGGSEAP